jgi:quercetin dioxygenase-like cupin family protein
MTANAVQEKIAAFEAQLKQAGCEQILDRVYGPNEYVALHSHEFAARAIVTAGEVSISCNEVVTCYRVGDIFELPAGQPHTEQYGPLGASYRVGRSYA